MTKWLYTSTLLYVLVYNESTAGLQKCSVGGYNESMKQFAKKLKAVREAKGMTQQQVADAAGIHRLSVAKLEQGVHEPTWATVQALAAALGVDCTAFQSDATKKGK